MQEDAGDINAATIPTSNISQLPIIIKDERITTNIGATPIPAATAASYSRQVDFKYESESSCGGCESTSTSTMTTTMTTTSSSSTMSMLRTTTPTPTPTNYKRKLMYAFGHAGSIGAGYDDDGYGGASSGGGASVVGKLEKDNMEMMATTSASDQMHPECKKLKLFAEKEQMFEQFQPWALKTYGDQAKTKTITLRKKARILKALEGKEHSRPDSSKFRFWVKSKAFTTKRPECFENIPDYPASSNTEYPNNIDLFVASTTKDFGQRIYRKVAVVEEFFNIIYNIHVEMGGRSGRHAGQKRTYRIITETFAFLPREAVTRFLSACPECKKNLRPLSPGRRSPADDEIPNESSSEIDVLNVSSQTESSIEIPKSSTPVSRVETTQPTTITLQYRKKLSPNPSMIFPKEELKTPTDFSSTASFTYPHALPKIRVNPTLQTQFHGPEPVRNGTPASSTAPSIATNSPQMNFGMLNRESLIRYYEFMRILYGQSMPSQPPVKSGSPAKKEPLETKLLIPQETTNLQFDEKPTTSAASLAIHSEPVQEPPFSTPSSSSQQVCAINLSKSFFSDEPSASTSLHQDVPSQKNQQDIKPSCSSELLLEPMPTMVPPQPVQVPGPPVKQELQTEQTQQLDLRKLKPITSTYLTLTRSMGLSDADALMLDDLNLVEKRASVTDGPSS
ncbi:uncharacterized protein LOC129914146 isoform X1 [Episyrphus balteatus]|uniref:uncharacterized protein LOC129914146 isoform X1 n=1 Tax=Episyrphus balteatus TaxID=286459 RepID=UPI00248531A8|nr:uncharacterized protein LOC129914146 isoform X1 [Episyrphus balteatus]